ncbi:phosphotransferase family protein [Chengkuizengella sediminis]|uniref:phosphotransferase family protein n=1 Tax=Chengkuizengella sediminis TaxID=1885917 RepID=UPI0013898CAB|nr:aminoglycoside phosphotransferase family protein [Chengkuizengella sediminis]NDI34486.1 aminoglycoside phosphotransferase family protein [Chengkuizengella sediminis]
MKENWERSNELILLSENEVTEMIKPFLNGRVIKEVKTLSGGLNNSNLKIITNLNETYVLRLYARDDIKGKVEKRIYERLADQLPVPKVLYADFSCEKCKTPFMIINWIQGIQLKEFMTNYESASSIEKIARQIGKYLAKLHTYQFEKGGFFDENLIISEMFEINSESFLKFIKESTIEGNAKKWLGDKFTNDIWNFVNEFSYLMDDIGHQTSLIHSDFNPLNILVDMNQQEANISAILDWEYSFSGTPLADVGNMLRYENTSSLFSKSFISAYKENGGVLPDDWLKKAKLLEIIGLSDLLNKKECNPNRIKDIKRLIQSTMNQWNNYTY